MSSNSTDERIDLSGQVAIVTGTSEVPVRVRISDDKVSIIPADELWGLDIIDTLDALESMEGKGVRALVIGPAGKHLSSIATIQIASSSAPGQGGFGGVMGSKKLKAISVSGSGCVSLTQPKVITSIVRVLSKRYKEVRWDKPFVFRDLGKLNQELEAEGVGLQ